MDIQPEVTIGMFGHVDHGKTTLTKALTGKFTDTHSEELKRGISIRLGYADLSIYYCEHCHIYTTKEECPACHSKTKLLRKVSFVDAPGHENLMTSVISASSIIDGAIFTIAANEPCPQEQTKEHMLLLDLLKIKNIIIVQTKVDLVKKEDALKHYKQIKEFVKGTVAENAPIIPVSSTYNINTEYILEAIQEYIPTPKRDEKKKPIAYSIRSFDLNEPGRPLSKLVGGVIGGSIVQGVFEIGNEIEIKPGIKRTNRYESLRTTIVGLASGSVFLKEAKPGGLIGISTKLDPSIAQSDNLSRNVIGRVNELPDEQYEMSFNYEIIKRKDINLEPIRKGDVLLLSVHSTTTIGVVTNVKNDYVETKLKLPVVLLGNDKIAISKRIGQRWRLFGIGIAKNQ